MTFEQAMGQSEMELMVEAGEALDLDESGIDAVMERYYGAPGRLTDHQNRGGTIEEFVRELAGLPQE